MAPRQRRLTGLTTVSRRIIMQKARRHPWLRESATAQERRAQTEICARRSPLPRSPAARRASTACRHVVSGSLSSPQRGSSHLSLALLGTLSVAGEYLALRDGPRSFRPASTWPVLLRCQAGGLQRSRTGLSPAMVALSRAVPLAVALLTPSHRKEPGPSTPSGRVQTVWAGARSLAATRAVAVAFFS
jgi:hypothetical protein